MRDVAVAVLIAMAILCLAIAENSLAADEPAAPPNCVAEAKWDADTGALSLQYRGDDRHRTPSIPTEGVL
jgi:hypothetical protein